MAPSRHIQTYLSGPDYFGCSHRVSGYPRPAGRTSARAFTEATDLAILAGMEPYFDFCNRIHAPGVLRSDVESKLRARLLFTFNKTPTLRKCF